VIAWFRAGEVRRLRCDRRASRHSWPVAALVLELVSLADSYAAAGHVTAPRW